MIIGVDGNEANVEKQVGVSVYTLNLLRYLKKKSGPNLQFRIFLREKTLTFLPEETNNFKYVVVNGKFFWSQLFLPLSLYLPKNKVDVFFSPAHYAPRFCPSPLVVTIHDLSYFYYPDEFLKKDLYKLVNWTKYSVNNAEKIITVSKTTKKDLMKFYEIPEEKISVIYNGYEKKSGNLKLEIKKFIGNWKLEIGNYILFVGTLQPRKNIIILIEAFSKLITTNSYFKLVIAGKKGWLFNEIFDLINKLNLKNKVIFTDHVSDEELIFLYKNAFCLVMPSLYEGFGIPLLEAMAAGCPVISSFSSSLPEVGGEAALYFDPKSSTDLLEKLNELLTNIDLRKDLIAKGKQRVKLFSWKKCADETLEVIRLVYDKNN